MRDLSWWLFSTFYFVKYMHCNCKHFLIINSLVSFINNVPNMLKYILIELGLSKSNHHFLWRKKIRIWSCKSWKRACIHLCFFNFHKPRRLFDWVKFLLCFFRLTLFQSIVSIWKKRWRGIPDRVNIYFIKVRKVVFNSEKSFWFRTLLLLSWCWVKNLEFR